MESSISNRIEIELARRFEDRMDVELIANALVSVWQEIDTVLRPIIGQRGVAALYQRSLHLAGRTYPWLATSHDGNQASIDFVHLKMLLMQQQRDGLIAGGSLLFKIFYDLLISLVGPSLTERLLRSVGAHLFSGPPAQDYA